MADLSKHRGKASALLAAGVVALAVIGGASVIVHARGGGAPTGTTAAPAPRPSDPSLLADGPTTPSTKVKIQGLAPWHPPRLPKRLKLKPVVRHGKKVITVVSSVAVALPAAPAGSAPVTPKTWSKHTAATPQKPRAPKKRLKPMKPVTPAKRPAATPPPSVTPSTGPPPATVSPPAVKPTSPSQPPPATPTTPTTPVQPPPPTTPTTPTTPTPPTTPTATATITGGHVAGGIVTATWAGADPAASTYQWQLCDQDGGACQPILNETAQIYTLKASDIGKTIRVSVVSGTSSSLSRATDQIERGG